MKKITAVAVGKAILILAFLSGWPAMVFTYETNVCPPLKLTSGRIRYRLRAKNVRFNCMRGYQLMGAKYASCMNGKWDAPTPICVKYGCRVPSTTHVNGQFIESYRGAVIKIICNPGYTLVGSPSVYCNGAKWNETFPVCNVFNKNPALSCDFESPEMCGWSQDPMQDFDWKRMDVASPPRGEIGGPGFDHTIGSNTSGVYMFIGSFEPRSENETAKFYSPVYPPEISNGSCFKFWYFMPEGNTDTLKVYVKPEGVELYDIIPSFWMSGDQGRYWVEGFFPIFPVETRFQIVIEGIKGVYYASDTAFDDVKIAFGSECIVLENTTTDYLTTGDNFEDQEDNYSTLSCKNRCSQASNWTSTSISHQVSSQVWGEKESDGKCGCQEQCIQAKTCCSDFFNYCPYPGSTTVESITDGSTSTQFSSSTLPTVLERESFSSSTAPPNDRNTQSNEIDPEKPIIFIPKVYLPEKPQMKPQIGQASTTRTQSVSTVPPVRIKIENVINQTAILPPENFNKTIKVLKGNTSLNSFPIKMTNVSRENKPFGVKLPNPKKLKVNFRPTKLPLGRPMLVQGRNDTFRGTNTTVEGPKINRTKNGTKSWTNFSTVTSSTSSTSPPRLLKFEKDEPSTNTSLWKWVKPTPLNPNDVTYRGNKPKGFSVSGKEPPQAIKIDANNDSRQGVSRQVLEIGGICTGLLVVSVILGLLFYRRSRNRKFERDNMVEDSDVRFLTSDEALDFTLARPADDDL